MIGDNWFKKHFEKILFSVVDRVGHSLSFSEKDKFVSVSLSVYSFIVSVGMFIFFIYFFSSLLYYKLGFERIIIILLTIIMLKVFK